MVIRASLPFREKTELFLLMGRRGVLAQDRGRYVMFPGGGLEAGESPSRAGVREALEETGAAVSGTPRHLATVDFVWFPQWANNPKRVERYRKYRGERVHILAGVCSGLSRPSDIEDAWSGARSMPIARCLSLTEKYGSDDHPNTYAYRIAQRMALQHLRVLSEVK